jgi:PPP family 3-phenylpropionic acid transporter
MEATTEAAGGKRAGGDDVASASAAAWPGFAVRLAIFYGAHLTIYGIQVPYFPVWLDWRGLSAAEIGLAGSAPFFVRCLLTPLIGIYADRHRRHRGLIILSAAIAVAATLALALAKGAPAIIALATLSALAVASIGPLSETIAMDGVRREGHDYGRMRLWGSITFIVASFAGGAIIQKLGAGVGIWLLFAGCVATLLAAFLLPRGQGGEAPRQATKGGMHLADVKALLMSPMFLVFMVAAGCAQSSHAMFYTFGVLHWQAQGLGTGTVGVLWAIGVIAEVILFNYSGAVVRRLGVTTILIVATGGALLRWTCMAFDPPLALLVPLQVLHAASFACSHLGAMHFIAAAVPRSASGTAQGFYATLIGMSQGLTTLAVSALYPVLAGKAYLAVAVLSAAALLAAFVLMRLWDGGRLWQSASEDAPPPAEPAVAAIAD